MSLTVKSQNSRRGSVSVRRTTIDVGSGGSLLTPSTEPILEPPRTAAATKTSMAKLAKSFQKKTAEKRQNDTWSNLIKNALILQRGKIPLLLAVEAGNQSMCRELLAAQTAEQLKVS